MSEADEIAVFERLLRNAIGLSADTVGPSIVTHAVRRRLAACGVAGFAEYSAYLAAHPGELQELIDAVIVPETWFFRDREAFAAMVRHLREKRQPGQPLRLLSLPCSTGEEPFSIAMALLDAGFPAADFAIDAIDVSTRNLAYAARAIYGRNSFRGTDLDYRARHFDPVEGGFRPHAAVIDRVRFSLGNLLDPSLALLRPESYDIVFCRNLLIYFDRETQGQALDRLRQALRQDGLLLVGPAESGLSTLHGFVSARMPRAFAFRKAAPPPPAVAALPLSKPRVVPPRPVPTAQRTRPAPVRASAAATAAPKASAPAEPDRASASLAAIERAANAGRLDEARNAATAHLARFGPSAEVYYLLSLADDAADAIAEAIGSYRKALYLAPDHLQAMAQLRLLLQRQGDATGAAALGERLGRIGKRSGA